MTTEQMNEIKQLLTESHKELIDELNRLHMEMQEYLKTFDMGR